MRKEFIQFSRLSPLTLYVVLNVVSLLVSLQKTLVLFGNSKNISNLAISLSVYALIFLFDILVYKQKRWAIKTAFYFALVPLLFFSVAFTRLPHLGTEFLLIITNLLLLSWHVYKTKQFQLFPSLSGFISLTFASFALSILIVAVVTVSKIVLNVGTTTTMPLLVQRVLPQSPADVAGLRVGDTILELNNQPIASATEFSEQIAKHSNQKIPLQIKRAGQKQTIEITPQKEMMTNVTSIGVELSQFDFDNTIFQSDVQKARLISLSFYLFFELCLLGASYAFWKEKLLGQIVATIGLIGIIATGVIVGKKQLVLSFCLFLCVIIVYWATKLLKRKMIPTLNENHHQQAAKTHLLIQSPKQAEIR